MLLCSLLLGWGMNAWVAYGTIFTPDDTERRSAIGTGASPAVECALSHFHYWVVTLDELDVASDTAAASAAGTNNEHACVVCWEPLTGQQFRLPVKSRKQFFTTLNNVSLLVGDDIRKRKHPFRFIYSLFRHDSFLLNIQQHPEISYDADSGTPMASFDITNARFWAKLSNTVMGTGGLQHPGASVTLSSFPNRDPIESLPALRDIGEIEKMIEKALMNHIVTLRNGMGLQTCFEDQLSLALQVMVVV